MRITLLWALLLAPFMTHAQTHILIQAGALLDVEAGSLLQNPTVLIDNQLIVAINPSAVPGKPLEDISVVQRVGFVMKEGVVCRGGPML